MAEILSPRIESIPEPRSGPQDKPAQERQAKAVAARKRTAFTAPQIGAADEEDKHNLDEMA